MTRTNQNMRRIFLFALVVSLCLGCTKTNPKLVLETEAGNIIVELYPDKAPITVANFLKYVSENRLEDATFYRTVMLDNQPNNDILIEVIQGGLYEDFHPNYLDPIEHETTKQTGILHKDGIISMARNEPGTATCEFFICMGDQPSLDYGGNRNSDGEGFAAFGKVIDGMDVVYKIHNSPASGQYLEPRIKIESVEIIKQ